MIEKLGERGHTSSRKTVKRMMDGLYELGLEPETLVLDADHHLTKRFKLTGIPSALLLLEPTEKAALERHLQTLPDGVEARAITKVLADVIRCANKQCCRANRTNSSHRECVTHNGN